MEREPLVSVIINNYNYGSYLTQAIDSAVNQTYPNVEVIVVDDGSTDSSRMIMEGYGKKIFSIYKGNGGQASAVNAGFQASHGSIIIILDADDFLLPHALEGIVKGFSTDKIAKIHWPLWQVDEEGKNKGKKIPEHSLVEGNLLLQLIELGPAHCGGPPESPPTSGNAWSRKFLERVLPIPETVFKGGIDNYLFVLLPLFGEIKEIAEPLGCYRVHGSNNTLKAEYRTVFFRRFEFVCTVLSDYLLKKDIVIDPDKWPRDHWFHKVDQAIREIEKCIPLHSAFILVDDDAWVEGDSVSGRKRHHLLETNGFYGGIAKNDDEAIEALDFHRHQGVDFIVFSWNSFWWLDHFVIFNAHLHSNYRCVMNNDRVIIFALVDNDNTISL